MVWDGCTCGVFCRLVARASDVLDRHIRDGVGGGAGRMAGIAKNAGPLGSNHCHSAWQCLAEWQPSRPLLRRAQAFLRHLAVLGLDGGAVVLLRIERLDLGVVLLL